MAKASADLLWKLAESNEVEIETRRDRSSPTHRATIWIVPEPERNARVVREASATYRAKYGGRWPDDTASMLRRSVRGTTLRLNPA